MNLIPFAPDNARQLSGTAYFLTEALRDQEERSLEVAPLRLAPHSELRVAQLLFMLRGGSLEARRGYSLSQDYVSAAYAVAGPVALEPQDLFLSFQQVAPREIIRQAASGCCRVAAYVDFSLAEYLSSYTITAGIPAQVRERLLREERACMAVYDLLFVFDEASRQAMIAEFGLDPARVVAVGRGANLSPANTADIAARRQARVRGDWLELLFLGADAKRKGLDEIVGGIDDLPGALRGRVHLHVVGPAREDVASRPFITSHGFLDRDADGDALLALLGRCDMGVMLSEAEGGVPSAILEYLSSGMPAIVTSLPRMRTFLDGQAVLFVDPADRRAQFGAALRLILTEADLLDCLARKAEDRKASFQWQPIARKIIDSMLAPASR